MNTKLISYFTLVILAVCMDFGGCRRFNNNFNTNNAEVDSSQNSDNDIDSFNGYPDEIIDEGNHEECIACVKDIIGGDNGDVEEILMAAGINCTMKCMPQTPFDMGPGYGNMFPGYDNMFLGGDNKFQRGPSNGRRRSQ